MAWSPKGRIGPGSWLGTLAALICLLSATDMARAGLVYTINTTTNPTTPVNTANPTNDGTVYATATFSTFVGKQIGSNTYSGIEVVLNNLLSYDGNGGEGRAISGVKFQFGNTTLGNALKAGSPTLVQDSGQEIKAATNTLLSTVTGSGGNFFHWGSGSDQSGSFHVETVGNFAAGGQPNHLVDPKLTSGSGYNSSFATHDNGFYTQAEFFIAFSNGVIGNSTTLTAADLANVEIQFGTSGNAFGPTSPSTTPFVNTVPAPPSAVLLFSGVFMAGLRRVCRRAASLVTATANPGSPC